MFWCKPSGCWFKPFSAWSNGLPVTIFEKIVLPVSTVRPISSCVLVSVRTLYLFSVAGRREFVWGSQEGHPPPPSLSGQLRLDLAKFRVGRQPVPKENWLPRPDLE